MIISVDPGFTRTAVMLFENYGEPLAYATFAADDTKNPSQHRAWDLATRMWKWVAKYVDVYSRADDDKFLIIERPIMGKNVENFEKQMRTFCAIISSAGSLADVIYEVNPMAMKKAATGNGAAKKIDIIGASPFDGPGNWGDTLSEQNANQEAVCDAWGIGVAYIKRAWDAVYTPRSTRAICSRGPIIEWYAT